MNALQRFRDWRHERRIKQLSAEMLRLFLAGEKTSSRIVDVDRMRLIRSRSAGQVERMEREKGLRI